MGKRKNDEDNESFISTFYYNNKILIWIFIIIVAFILIMKYFEGRNNEEPPVQDEIKLVIENKNNVMVGIGNTVSLKANINVLDAVINWSSSNPSVAKVSNGNVTGVTYGKSKITATYIDSTGVKYTDTCEVSVIEGNPNITLNSISFPDGDLYMPINREYQLNLVLNPSNALINNKTFISSNESVVSVNSDGLIKSHKAGYARIIATVNGNYQTATDVYVDSKYQKSEIVISPKTISFDTDTRKIKLGSSEKLNYTITPSNADRSKLTWSSNETSIVSVDQNGVITGKEEGETIVSVVGVNGQRADIIVEVYSEIIPVRDISIAMASPISMEAGKTMTIKTTIVPSNASNLDFVSYSDDPTVASVTVTGTRDGIILSALKKGSATITLRSGSVRKTYTVNVTGDGNNSEVDEGGSNFPTTITVRSDKNNLAKTYEEAKKIPSPGVATVTVKMATGVDKIKYCYYKYGESACKPKDEQWGGASIMIPSGDIYVLRIIKYDYNGKEITSTSPNYIDGVLNYYINTKVDDESAKHYTVTGAYETSTMATTLPKKIGDKVVIKVTDNTRHLMVCSATNTTCTPTIRVNNTYTFTINKTGTTRIYINEFDNSSSLRIGGMQIYYVYVKPAETTNTTNNTNNNDTTTHVDNTSTDTINVSKLGVYQNSTVGKYLSVLVESNINISNVRFCYKVVNKGTTSSCNLNTTSTVSMHDGSTYFHPQEELKTYYGSFTSTKSKTLMFDIDALDTFYTNNTTNKDVILEFAVKSSKGFFTTAKVRINMTKKDGNDSYWNSTFIK